MGIRLTRRYRARFCYVRDKSQHDRASARKFPAKFDVIAPELDVFEHMFDVIVNEVKKNSSNARKLEAGRDSLFEKRDVITISQIKTEPRRVKHAARFNLQR